MSISAWLRSFFRRPPVGGMAVPAPQPTELPLPLSVPSLSPRPAFIKIVAQSLPTEQSLSHEHDQTVTGQDRDPGRALGRLRSRASGSGDRGRSGSRSAADATESVYSGLAAFSELENEVFTAGTAGLEHRNGAEHDAFFDPETSRVIKLTQPGEFGAWGGLAEYLQRLAWSNEFFDDDWLVEGWLHYPNEPAPRLVTSQPWYRVRPERPEPSMAEIDAYLWQMGWLKAYDGAWIHAKREIAISDALPKNFVIDVADYVQPIDLIILTPSADQWERLQSMAQSVSQG